MKKRLNYSEFIAFKARPEEAAALRRLQRAYGLASLSEAARRVIRSVAADRGLLEEVSDGTGT